VWFLYFNELTHIIIFLYDFHKKIWESYGKFDKIKNLRKNCGFFFTYVVFITWKINIVTFLCKNFFIRKNWVMINSRIKNLRKSFNVLWFLYLGKLTDIIAFLCDFYLRIWESRDIFEKIKNSGEN